MRRHEDSLILRDRDKHVVTVMSLPCPVTFESPHRTSRQRCVRPISQMGPVGPVRPGDKGSRPSGPWGVGPRTCSRRRGGVTPVSKTPREPWARRFPTATQSSQDQLCSVGGPAPLPPPFLSFPGRSHLLCSCAGNVAKENNEMVIYLSGVHCRK